MCSYAMTASCLVHAFAKRPKYCSGLRFAVVFHPPPPFSDLYTSQFQFNEVDAVVTYNLSSGKDEVSLSTVYLNFTAKMPVL